MREISYSDAIRESLRQAMELDPAVMVLGQLADTKAGIFGTTTGLVEQFGPNRVQDFPVSEATMTSVALGSAVNGMRPVIVHQRLDFMIYSLDSIVNWLSLWHFKSNGKSTAPVTIRCIVGKGWGQGPQHSKSLHAWFAHLPGLRVAMPSTAFDAKGLLLESIFGQDPTIIIEGRSLFSMKNAVPEEPYRVRFGHAAIRKPGSDITLISVGLMMPYVLRAAALLAQYNISAEVIDLRTISPLDSTTILESVNKTKRIAVVDPGWRSVGFAAEIITTVAEELGDKLLSRPLRITLPDSHTPMSRTLEDAYYPDDSRIAQQIMSLYSSNTL